MNITVNGKLVDMSGRTSLTYDNLCVIAGERPGASMVYRVPSGAAGSLYAGDSIILADGMIFNVCMTGSA